MGSLPSVSHRHIAFRHSMGAVCRRVRVRGSGKQQLPCGVGPDLYGSGMPGSRVGDDANLRQRQQHEQLPGRVLPLDASGPVTAKCTSTRTSPAAVMPTASRCAAQRARPVLPQLVIAFHCRRPPPGLYGRLVRCSAHQRRRHTRAHPFPNSQALSRAYSAGARYCRAGEDSWRVLAQ